MSLDEVIELFASADDELRVDLLLDHARRLPALPPRYEAMRLAGDARVPECVTPVHLWVEQTPDGLLDIHVHVAPEAPTVAGFMGLVRQSLQGRPLADAMALPTDLVHQLGLDGLLRMNRTVGLSAMVGRIRRQAARLAGQAVPAADQPSTSHAP